MSSQVMPIFYMGNYFNSVSIHLISKKIPAFAGAFNETTTKNHTQCAAFSSSVAGVAASAGALAFSAATSVFFSSITG